MKVSGVKLAQYPLTKDQIFQNALDVINDFVAMFQNSSKMLFLYESDIQAHLLMKLRERIPPVSFSEISGKDIENIFKLNVVTSEYPVAKRFDIACINPFMIEDYISWLTGQNEEEWEVNFIFWELPLLFAIELKFLFYESKTKSEDIKKDYLKLKNYDDDFHITRHPKLRKSEVRFTDDFQFLSLNFYQDNGFFERDKQKFIKEMTAQKVKRIDRFDCIYLISDREIMSFFDRFVF